MDIIQNLNWRYATKRMNGSKIPQSALETIKESIRLSPSSVGLQPYKILIVESEELKKKISPPAFNQPQITESSHVLVFTVWKSLTDLQASEYLAYVQSERGVSLESLSTLENYLNNIKKMSEDDFYNWSSKQAYIALSSAILASAELKIDSTPMEGFSKEDLDKALGLSEKNLKSVVLLALGYRDEKNDWLLKMKKVRRKEADLFTQL
ncbi:MAG: NAD(P)H-dependent oxidoreductase [Spirochaetia bacterium]|nr:NAD(P)H-dependent oxidoreductase [Spirochaetia bacterium]